MDESSGLGRGSGTEVRDKVRVKAELRVRFRAHSETGWSHVRGA